MNVLLATPTPILRDFWIASGQTVTSSTDNVLGVSGPDTEFIIGQSIQIENTTRVVVNYWEGGEGLILNEEDPPIEYTVGAEIFVQNKPVPINVVDAGQYNDGSQDWWLYLCTEDYSGLYAGSKIIGQWNVDGSIVNGTQIDPDYTVYIRPLGNQSIQGFVGVATPPLRYQYWLGNEQRDLQAQPVPETLIKYPADTQPIILTMARRFDDTPGFEGEGWVATIEFNSPDRAPDARAIAIYTDPDHQNFLYTTGAFVFTDQGDGTFKWQTVNPPGRVTQNPEPIYYALLFGSLQEGRMTLDETQTDRTDFFWDQNQGGASQLSEVPIVTQETIPVTHEQEGVTHA